MENEEAKAADAGFKPITSQEEFDSLIRDRLERAKRQAVPADYDEVKSKAAELQDAVDKGASDLKAMTERAQAAEAERDELRHAAELEGWKAEVSAGTGVPASVLRGNTLEDIRAHAEAIRSSMPVYPQVTETGGGTAPMGKQQILSIEDARERKAAILANLDLFN